MSRLVRTIALLALLIGLLGPSALRVSAQDSQTGNRDSDDDSTATATSDGGAGTYTSPTYGYSISYDDSWEVAKEDSQGGYDVLELDSENSSFYLEGYADYDGDPETCVEQQVDDLKQSASVLDFDYVQDENGDPTTDSSPELSYALVQVSIKTDSGDTGDLVIYVECRPLVPDVAVLVISQYMSPSVYEQELDRKDAIVDTLEMGDATTGGTKDSDVDDDNTDDSDTTDTGDAEQQMIDLLEETEQDVDTYWSAMFDANDWGEYEPPTYVNFTDDIDTGCGAVSPNQVGPFYCPPDKTVYFDVEWMTNELAPYGDFVIKFAAAHEIGHHIQNLLGLKECDVTQCLNGYTSLQIELMADCFGGSWASQAHERGLLAAGDVENAIVALSEFLGDPANSDNADASAHGPGSLRTWWFLKGYYDGASACFAGGQ